MISKKEHERTQTWLENRVVPFEEVTGTNYCKTRPPENQLAKRRKTMSNNEAVQRMLKDPQMRGAFNSLRDMLDRHFSICIDGVENLPVSFPNGFISNCRSVFDESKDGMTGDLVTFQLRELEHSWYQNPSSGIHVVFTILPWNTDEAVTRLAEISSEPPFGYVNILTDILNSWPSAEFKFLLHVLVCFDGVNFRLHLGLRHFAGTPVAEPDFDILPVDLLNAQEKELAGL